MEMLTDVPYRKFFPIRKAILCMLSRQDQYVSMVFCGEVHTLLFQIFYNDEECQLMQLELLTIEYSKMKFDHF